MQRLGMSGKERGSYSILRAINAAYTGNWSQAGLEAEWSRNSYSSARKSPATGHSFMVPNDWILGDSETRDLTVSTGSAGGFLVSTKNVSFAELLRNRMIVKRLGATVLDNLDANVTVPRQTAGATGYWLSTEATAITESQPVFGQIAMVPKTVGAYTEISRQLAMQSSPSAELLVMNDLAKVVALAGDLAAINGSGASGQPQGLLNTSGIGSVSGGTLSYSGIVEFQTDVAASNALSESCAYVGTPTVAGVLKGRQRFASTDTPLWTGNIFDGQIEGFRAMASNQVPAATLIFGDWSHVLIGEWGNLEIQVNPYANFQAGILGVRAMYSMDVGVRYPGGFSVATSVT
jgi:HK97 family phage major capsid protein